MVLLGLQGLLGQQIHLMESPMETVPSLQLVIQEPLSHLQMEHLGLLGLPALHLVS